MSSVLSTFAFGMLAILPGSNPNEIEDDLPPLYEEIFPEDPPPSYEELFGPRRSRSQQLSQSQLKHGINGELPVFASHWNKLELSLESPINANTFSAIAICLIDLHTVTEMVAELIGVGFQDLFQMISVLCPSEFTPVAANPIFPTCDPRHGDSQRNLQESSQGRSPRPPEMQCVSHRRQITRPVRTSSNGRWASLKKKIRKSSKFLAEFSLDLLSS